MVVRTGRISLLYSAGTEESLGQKAAHQGILSPLRVTRLGFATFPIPASATFVWLLFSKATGSSCCHPHPGTPWPTTVQRNDAFRKTNKKNVLTSPSFTICSKHILHEPNSAASWFFCTNSSLGLDSESSATSGCEG